MREIAGNNWNVTFANRIMVANSLPVPSILASNMIIYLDESSSRCSTMEQLMISKTDNSDEWAIMYFETARDNIIGCRVCKIDQIEATLKDMNILHLDDVISDILAKVKIEIDPYAKISNNNDMAEIMSDIMVRLDVDRNEFGKDKSQKDYTSRVVFYPNIGDPKTSEHISRVRDALVKLVEHLEPTEFSKFGYDSIEIKSISVHRDTSPSVVAKNFVDVTVKYKLK